MVGLKTIFYHPFSPFAGCWESTLELLESSSTWVGGVLFMALVDAIFGSLNVDPGEFVGDVSTS